MKIIIGPQGLEGSLSSFREGGQNDGMTYFGRKKSVKKNANDPSQIEATTTVSCQSIILTIMIIILGTNEC